MQRAPSGLDTYYSTQITIRAALPNGHVTGSLAVDIFLRITGNQNHPPAWSTTTPADGTTYNVTPGQTVTIPVSATDPDANDIVTLGAVGAPAGSFTQTSGHTATGTLAFVPNGPGTTIVNFTAADQNGLGAQPRSIRVVAAQQVPDITWAAPGMMVWGAALDGTQLNAAFSTASGAHVPPHPGTFTYTPTAGTIPEPGDQTLSVTWTPDPADGAGWAPTTLTNTVHVNKADQTLSFTPPIDPSTHYTYGDGGFSVVATSTSNLTPSYGVGTADSCAPPVSQPPVGFTVAITGSGTCTVTVTQAGDAHYNPAPPLSHTFTIAQQTPTISWTPGAMTYGQNLSAAQLNATVDQAEAGSNGTLTYTVDGAPADTSSTLAAGDHTLTVAYTPNSGSPGSNYTTTAKTVLLTVAKADQTITFAGPSDVTFGDSPFTINPTADSGLPVDATSTTPGVCAVSAAGQVSIAHAGTCTITASQPGDSNHNAAPAVTRSFTVNRAPQTITFTGPGNLTYGDPNAALNATSGSGDPVAFTATPTGICSLDPTGTALVIDGAGMCTVTASQGGNGDYSPAADVVVPITIAKATPHLSWTTPAAIDYGTPLSATQLNASLTPGNLSGDISYFLADGTTPADGAKLNASAAPQALVAVFTPGSGDADNWNGARTTTTIIVNKADQVITLDPVANHTYGDAPFIVTGHGGASGNPVTFTSTAPTCTVTVDGTVTITAAGECAITANQAGNDNYNPAASTTTSLTVAKATPGITWATPGHITYGTPVGGTQLNATINPADAAANGALGYTTDVGTGPAAGQILHAGQHTLTATYTPNASPGGNNYTGASQQVQLVVDKASQSLTFPALPDATFGAGPITLAATPGASGATVTYTIGVGSACTVSGATLTLTGAGTCSVTANEAGNGDYLPAPPVSRGFTIAKASQAITFAAPSNKTVGDPAFTVTATGGGSGNPVTFTAGPAPTCTITGGTVSITGPGTCTVTASQAGNANYLDAAPVSRSFAVAYRICTLSDPGEVHHAGSADPIKVSLCDSIGRSLSATGIVLHATGVDGSPAVASGNSAGPDNNFRYVGTGGGSYQYNLKTDGLAAGTHRFTWTITGDPTVHSTNVVIG
jgi:hypothetical protein